jgi:hypothetical protein
MKRINNPEKYIRGIVEPGRQYYIGFGINDLTDLGKAHPDIKALVEGSRSQVVLTGKKGALRQNTVGKYVRKKPESKTSVWRHIEYYSNKWEKIISYDREFFIWEKELLHKFDLELSVARTPQKEIVLVFPVFTMVENEAHYMRAGAAMNMACALSNYHLMYDLNFEPIIPVTKFKDKALLPAGMTGKSVKEKLQVILENLASEADFESSGNSYRFAILKELGPDDVTIGAGGFNEYLMFEFKKHNIVVLENLKSGNATYLFRLSDFNLDANLDKQNAAKNQAFLKRIVHENSTNWSSQLGRYFS